jgi:tyrosyl-tRNA synthetase
VPAPAPAPLESESAESAPAAPPAPCAADEAPDEVRADPVLLADWTAAYEGGAAYRPSAEGAAEECGPPTFIDDEERALYEGARWAPIEPPPPPAVLADPRRYTLWIRAYVTGRAAARFALVRSVGEECVQEGELRALLAAKPHPVCYDGFEPSGRMHIAQGLLKAAYVNRLTRAGCTFKFWVADWFALLNNKLGGDAARVRTVGRYMVEVWRACGMDMGRVQFLWASDCINAAPEAYWGRVMDVARAFNVPRVLRCCTALGREESDVLSAAQLLYPCMQCADVFFLGADVCQLGLDQRKVNMLAREYAARTHVPPPVVLSHHMLMGLKEGQAKMSKSDPDSAIFMEDSAAEVGRKVGSAFCPPRVVEGNPCLDWVKHVVFGTGAAFRVVRKPKFGGDSLYACYADVERDYVSGALHPGDLKPALASALNALLEPVRAHFASGPNAELLAEVRGFTVTR